MNGTAPIKHARKANAFRACAGALLAVLCLAAPALGGPPSHSRDEGRDLSGFDHACGTAVDAAGNVYVSSAGEDEIQLFDPSGSQIKSIANSNEPCSLAVDGDGSLYVSEQETGEVVRYEPPSYSAREVIDASGEAKGISVDPFDDRLYVAKGGRIDAYNSEGTIGENERQQVNLGQSEGGTFRLALPGEGGPGRNEIQRISRASAITKNYTLTFDGETTSPLEAEASAAAIEAALAALSTVGGTGNVSVVGFKNRTKWIEFEGALAETNVPLITSGQVTATALSDITAPIPYGSPAGDVEDALELLEGINSGNVSVKTQGSGYGFTFIGALAHTDVLDLAGDPSSLTPDGSGFNPEANVTTSIQGWDGHIGEGAISEATGVAPYTYRIDTNTRTRYLDVADADGDTIETFSGTDFRAFKHRRTITGIDEDGNSQIAAGEEFGFGVEGAALAADRGNRSGEGCAKVGNQACTAGHFLLYDDAHDAIDEFDASGEFLDRITDEALADAEPTGLSVDRSGGPSDGTIYASVGTGPGAEVLGFKPLVTPDRSHAEDLSHVLTQARALETDRFGNVYAASGPFVHLYGPDGLEITKASDGSPLLEDPRNPYDLAVDSDCNVFVLDGTATQEKVAYYDASSCPPVPTTTYTRHDFYGPLPSGFLEKIAVNPADGHPFVLTGGTTASPIIEFGAAPNVPLVDECGAGLGFGPFRIDLDVYGATGEVFVSENPANIYRVDCDPEERLTHFKGGGCPDGQFGASPAIAVDQSNGHVLEFAPGQAGANAREYDASGACVAQFGVFGDVSGGPPPYSIAVDNSGGPNDGYAYVAFDANNNAVQPYDVNAFRSLSYGEVPEVTLGVPAGLGDAEATLRGSVDPKGFALEECRFEYLTQTEYDANEEAGDPLFEGAVQAQCDPTAGEIDPGTEEAVAVHAEIGGLDPEVRYRYRLLAANEFGEDTQASLFGPPLAATKPALSIFYDEATLRGALDPSGLMTGYRFQYATEAYYQAHEAYDHATPPKELAPGDGEVSVTAVLPGLAEGTTYHFRLIAQSEVLGAAGEDLTFRTRKRAILRDCPNSPYRTGLSAKLPDCRAYELTTPADTHGQVVNAAGLGGRKNLMSNFLAASRGAEAGESVGFFSGTLPGFEGGGETDGYRARRGTGAHPKEGWSTELYAPTYAQQGAAPGNHQEGVGPDQRYWLWNLTVVEAFPNTLAGGLYLRTPAGVASEECNDLEGWSFQPEFERVGCGTLGTDPDAFGHYLSDEGEHVLFSSAEHLEVGAPPAGTEAIYDRRAGEAEAEVISVEPDDGDPETDPVPFGSDATFLGASEDGTAVVFGIGLRIFVHRAGQTIEVADDSGPHAFAGISANGTRVFYAAATYDELTPLPGTLFACDIAAGPCVGGGEEGLTEIAEESVFVNVAADGAVAFFTSEKALDTGTVNENGEVAEEDEPNLYAWDGTTNFVARLDPGDLVGNAFGEASPLEHLLSWTPAAEGRIGRANSPARSTPDGDALLFQSHARLTGFDNQGVAQIYRYAGAAAAGERLLCVSCDPTGAPPTGEALLQDFSLTAETTMILNITDDGDAVYFESPDHLSPEDANDVVDVYQWKARGAGQETEKCTDPSGCLSLISSGQGERDSHLFGMSAEGDDVFFGTSEDLVEADAPGSPSIYDARVEGGIPDPPAKAPCPGDACQPLGSLPPTLPSPTSTAAVPEDNVTPDKRRGCAKGKRRVKRKGKVRCVKPKKKAKRHRHRTGGAER